MEEFGFPTLEPVLFHNAILLSARKIVWTITLDFEETSVSFYFPKRQRFERRRI